MPEEQSLYIDGAALAWRDTPFPGVEWKKLHFDPKGGDSAVLLRFTAGASYGAHRHPEGEEYLVLDGSLQDGGAIYGTGTWVRHPPGSIHRPISKAGCILFVRLPRPIELVDSES